MAKVTVIQVIYNNRRFIEPVFSEIFSQTFIDMEVVAVIAGNDDGSKEFLAEKFPQVKIIDPGYNIGFAKGHNLVFETYCETEFYQLVNPDLVMEPDYIEKMLKAFTDPKVGAATGKLLKCSFNGNTVQKTNIIDSTGVVINKSGSARDRGQHEIDKGQYDKLVDVQAASAAGAMYRRSALEAIKMQKRVQGTGGSVQNKSLHAERYTLNATYEYFDEDFHSYWEDVDLAWRMVNAGWKCKFVPQAIAYHGRGAGSSKGGYKKVFSYIKFHRTIPQKIRELNYKNHIFMYIKNSRWFYPQFFIREFFMLGFIILFETRTLKAIPEFFRLLPKMWNKRKLIKNNTSILRSIEV